MNKFQITQAIQHTRLNFLITREDQRLSFCPFCFVGCHRDAKGRRETRDIIILELIKSMSKFTHAPAGRTGNCRDSGCEIKKKKKNQLNLLRFCWLKGLLWEPKETAPGMAGHLFWEASLVLQRRLCSAWPRPQIAFAGKCIQLESNIVVSFSNAYILLLLLLHACLYFSTALT